MRIDNKIIKGSFKEALKNNEFRDVAFFFPHSLPDCVLLVNNSLTYKLEYAICLFSVFKHFNI